MSYFKEKLQKKYVTLKKEGRLTQPELPCEIIVCENVGSVDDFDAPYVECVKKYCEEKKDYTGQRILLVSDDTNVVLKAAALLSTNRVELDGEDDEDEEEWCSFDEYDEYEEEVEYFSYSSLIHFDFHDYLSCDKKDIVYRTVVTAGNAMSESNILFTGLENDSELENALQAIAFCKKPNQYIAIGAGQLKLPAVQKMVFEHGFEPLVLPALDMNYYKEVLDYLLKDEAYTLARGLKKEELLQRLQKQRDGYLCEEDLSTLLNKGVDAARKDHCRQVLRLEDFTNLISTVQVKAWDHLMAMTGLDEVKEVAEELVAYAKEQQINPKLQFGHNHMLFYGKPGTGKTTLAKILADVLAEAGCGNGKCVVATRKDLVGAYVGHTAPMVAKKFEEAKGGILFVDEAGFFLQKESGGFVDEAMKEFVRYMETESDVTVIFAMYPGEAKVLLDMDDGLRSRIKRFIRFKDYSNEQLMEIAMTMFDEKGYKVDKNCATAIESYILKAKEQEKEKFGNARAMRNLVETAIGQVSLRHFREGKKAVKLLVTAEDVNHAVKKLQGIYTGKVSTYGFYHANDSKAVTMN